MSAKLKIQDGNPIWMSPSIIPSTNGFQSTQTRPNPTLLPITENSRNISVYVKVENNGTEDFGTCTCGASGNWLDIDVFSGYTDNYRNARGTETHAGRGGSTYTIDRESINGDFLTIGGIDYNLGPNASKRWAWAWSSDGNLFAYVYSPTAYFPGNSSANPRDWNLVIIALNPFRKPNGTTVARGSEVCRHSGVLNAPNVSRGWNASNFGWAKSKAVIVSGVSNDMVQRDVVSPYAPINTESIPYTPTPSIEWQNLVSPCGSMVAFMPRKKNQSASNTNFEFVSTITGQKAALRFNNANIGDPHCTGDNPGISTLHSGAGGLEVKSGNKIGTLRATQIITLADDPDCTFIGGGITVRVDRVKASTLPSANLGVVGIGEATLGVLEKAKSAWVEVPKMVGNDWNNGGESHWCLLAQAYTSDGSIIQRPWDGQATIPVAFPVQQENCAQRNVEINP
jgi:hypothetical protein